MRGITRWITVAVVLLAGAAAVPAQPRGDAGHRDRLSASQKPAAAYERGARALDERAWSEAVARFREVAAAKGARADGALYWEAYALMKQAEWLEAQKTIEELRTSYPQSRWLDDADALELTLRQSAGQPPDPEASGHEELKLLAINSLATSDPARAVPLLEKVIEGPNSPKLKERALFVLAMTKSAEALPIVESLAKGEGNPDLQLKAIEYLGMLGGDREQKTLAEIYEGGDNQVKRRVLRAYMMTGNRAAVLAAATGNAPIEVRKDAIRQLGAMRASDELWQIFQSSTSTDIRTEVLRALAISGNPARLMELARTESDPALRSDAIKMLGMNHKPEVAEFLVKLYGSNLSPQNKEDVIKALFIQGNAKALVYLARRETDPELKKQLVRVLALMKAPEATDYMIELLEQK